MANSLADAYCTIVPKFDGLKSRLESELNKVDGKSAGSKLGSELGNSAGAGLSDIFKGNLFANLASSALTSVASAVGGAITQGAQSVVSGVSEAVSSFADAQQLTGGVEKIFGDSASKVENYAANAYEAAGVSANDYMQQVTSFSSSLLQSMGGDTSAAADMANQAIVDMSDNANIFGSDISSIQYAYQGFAKQNYTISAATLQAAA